MPDAVTALPAAGDAGPETGKSAAERLRLIWRNVFPFVVVSALWEIVAWLGIFPLEMIASVQ